MKKCSSLIFILIFSGACHGQVNSGAFNLMLKSLLKGSVPYISVSEAKQKTDKIIFLDTREKKEYDVSHIKNARWVGYEKFDIKNIKDIPKDTEIIVYCSVGYRSEKIGEKLIKAGYKNVKNLYGSIFEWKNEGLPVYDNTGKQTNKVHTYNKTWGIWLQKGTKVY